jgi:hypothetical protein
VGFLEAKLVLIGLSGAGAAFLECNFPKRKLIGTLVLPEIPMVRFARDVTHIEEK